VLGLLVGGIEGPPGVAPPGSFAASSWPTVPSPARLPCSIRASRTRLRALAPLFKSYISDTESASTGDSRPGSSDALEPLIPAGGRAAGLPRSFSWDTAPASRAGSQGSFDFLKDPALRSRSRDERPVPDALLGAIGGTDGAVPTVALYSYLLLSGTPLRAAQAAALLALAEALAQVRGGDAGDGPRYLTQRSRRFYDIGSRREPEPIRPPLRVRCRRTSRLACAARPTSSTKANIAAAPSIRTSTCARSSAWGAV